VELGGDGHLSPESIGSGVLARVSVLFQKGRTVPEDQTNVFENKDNEGQENTGSD